MFDDPTLWRWSALALVAALLGGVLTYLAVTTPVTLAVDGEEHRARTVATEVEGALEALGVDLRPGDEVEPPPDTALESGTTITVRRASILEVVIDDPAAVLDLDGERRTLRAVAGSIGAVVDTATQEPSDDALAELATLREDERVRLSPPADTPLGGGERLEVLLEVARPVTLTVDGETQPLHTFAGTVGQLLDDREVTLGAHDRVDPARGTVLDEVEEVRVRRVEVTEEVEEVVVEHDVDRRETDELPKGEEEVATEGEDGLRHDTYEVVRVEGEEESRERIDQQLVREPVDEVRRVGTASPEPDPEPAPEPDPEPEPEPEPTPAPPPDDGQEIHLTFDDGPHPTYTPQILDLLAAYDATGTFFMVGEEVAAHPQVAQRVASEGHVIGNHTWSHARLTEVDEPTFAAEILDTQAVLEDTVGQAPTCLRPPFGARDDAVNQGADDLGLRMAMWDVDPRDWERPGTDTIVDRVRSEVQPGDVVLLHDGFRDRGQTVAALERLLAELSDRGYRFTAMPGC